MMTVLNQISEPNEILQRKLDCTNVSMLRVTVVEQVPKDANEYDKREDKDTKNKKIKGFDDEKMNYHDDNNKFYETSRGIDLVKDDLNHVERIYEKVARIRENKVVL